MDWDNGVVRPVAFDRLGQRYRRYRLADPVAEDAMAGSLRRWGQLSPVVACVRGENIAESFFCGIQLHGLLADEALQVVDALLSRV